MKKQFLKTMLISSVFLLLATPALAANFIFSPATVNMEIGKTFNLTVSLNPGADKNTTIKMEIKFPADLLQVNSFSFGNTGSWIALAQPGYDLIDNTNGVLIKTAGYPGGVASQLVFGTVNFTTKKAGNGKIQIGANSLALDGNNKNTLTAAPVETNVVIAAPKPVEPVTTGQTEGVVAGEKTTAPVVTKPAIKTVSVPETKPESVTTQNTTTEEEGIVAGTEDNKEYSVKATGGFWSWFKWVLIIIALLAISIVGRYFIWKRKKNNNDNNLTS
jgi:hypothetical protein